jgi:hypothetical protein
MKPSQIPLSTRSLGIARFHLWFWARQEAAGAIPENLKDELKRLAKRYKKHNGDTKKLLLELTRHHIDLIANASEESNQTFNKMMGLAAVYMSKL